VAATVSRCETALSGEPNIVDIVVHGSALVGNLLKDDPDRAVIVYLPPGYADTDRRYPVVYLLHPYIGTNRLWTGDAGYDIHVGRICDKLILGGQIQPMIIVAPDCHNRYKGSFYTNSSVTGNWEDFVAEDLVSFIDESFRTLASPASRGIAGHSMGGYGAIKIGVKNHDKFSAIYAMSSVPLDFRREVLAVHQDSAALKDLSEFDRASWFVKVGVAQAAAFTPNPEKPPFFVDFPCDADGNVIDAVYDTWKNHDPCSLARTHRQTLIKQHFYFDCGFNDSEGLVAMNRYFVSQLQSARIPFIYEEYDGDHANRVKQRLATRVLPFFSRVLLPDDTFAD
jgi:enterochelin esterase-like enzyme